jgi:hypothetical protein
MSDWLYKRYNQHPEIWRHPHGQGEMKAIAWSAPLPFVTCAIFTLLCARLNLHSYSATLKLALAIWFVGPLPLLIVNGLFNQAALRNYCVLFSRMAGETRGGCRGCNSDSALGRGMASQNVGQKHRHQEDRRIANRSAINERAAQGNLSQFNSLDFLLPWFGTSRSVVQIHSRTSIRAGDQLIFKQVDIRRWATNTGSNRYVRFRNRWTDCSHRVAASRDLRVHQADVQRFVRPCTSHRFMSLLRSDNQRDG